MQFLNMHATAKVSRVVAVWILLILCCGRLLECEQDVQIMTAEDLDVAATRQTSVTKCIGKYALGCARCRNGKNSWA
jgi:hypothetical protein